METSKINKKQIREFLKRKEFEGIGVVQRLKYIQSIRSLLKFSKKSFNSYIEQDLQNFILSLSNYKPKTKHIRWYCIKKFFEFLGKEELYRNLKPRFLKKKTKLPEELLTEKEVNKMIEKAYSIRDKALISALYESGCRIGELLSRKIRHMSFDKFGAVLIVDGKTGARRIRLIQSVPLLANWISNHPKQNPESFLWISLNNYTTPIKYGIVNKLLKETAQRAKINKNIYPHLFRHSRATHLANKLTEQQLKIYFGWVGGSEMASIYVHLSGRDVDEAILQLNGIQTDTENYNNISKQVTCFRCSSLIHSSSKICPKCGMILDPKEAFEMKDSNDKDFHKFLMEMYKKWKNRKQE